MSEPHDARLRQMERDSIDAAWAAVEAVLPKDAWLDGVQRTSYDDDAPWEATACGPIPAGVDIIAATGPTPAAALRALAAKLAER